LCTQALQSQEKIGATENKPLLGVVKRTRVKLGVGVVLRKVQQDNK